MIKKKQLVVEAGDEGRTAAELFGVCSGYVFIPCPA
jgi:hypothetical protein